MEMNHGNEQAARSEDLLGQAYDMEIEVGIKSAVEQPG